MIATIFYFGYRASGLWVIVRRAKQVSFLHNEYEMYIPAILIQPCGFYLLKWLSFPGCWYELYASC